MQALEKEDRAALQNITTFPTAADLMAQEIRDLRNKTNVLEHTFQSYLSTLPEGPSKPTANLLLKAIGLYHQRNQIAHPANPQHRTAELAKYSIKRIEKLCASTTLVDDEEKGVIKYCISNGRGKVSLNSTEDTCGRLNLSPKENRKRNIRPSLP